MKNCWRPSGNAVSECRRDRLADWDTLRLAVGLRPSCDLTVYTIRANRSSDVILDILGDHFSGILTSDGLLSYDDRRLKDWLEQKCLSHLLKDLKEMNETKSGRALHFARQATNLLQEALALKREKPSLSSRTFSQRAA